MARIGAILLSVAKQALRTWWILLKLMVPVSIIIRIIQELNLLPTISGPFETLMQLCGLPAETALVWITALIVNIYAALIALMSIYPTLPAPLTLAQLTVLGLMVLVAHTFPIELRVAQKAGVRIWFMLSLRLFGALMMGFLLSRIYNYCDAMQTPARLGVIASQAHPSWLEWAGQETLRYFVILGIIATLMLVMRILDEVGVMRWLNQALMPLLRWLGMGGGALPITIAGLTLGLAYGGGLIINESKGGRLSAKDVVYSLALMGLFHSMIEDTLLLLGVGAHASGVVLFRILMAFLITYIIVRLTRLMDTARFERLFTTRAFRNRSIQPQEEPQPTTA